VFPLSPSLSFLHLKKKTSSRILVLYTESWRYDRTPQDNDIIFRALNEGRDEPVLHPGLAPGRHTEGRWEALFMPVTNCTTPGMEWATVRRRRKRRRRRWRSC
jgi:hypothetical protein